MTEQLFDVCTVDSRDRKPMSKWIIQPALPHDLAIESARSHARNHASNLAGSEVHLHTDWTNLTPQDVVAWVVRKNPGGETDIIYYHLKEAV